MKGSKREVETWHSERPGEDVASVAAETLALLGLHYYEMTSKDSSRCESEPT